MSDNDNFGAFLVGFIMGGITGAVASLLLAPQSGEETRTVIKERAIELKDKSADTAEETLHKAEKVAADAAEKTKTLVKTTADKAAETIKKKPVVLESEKPAPKE
ncbi:MAG: YtxH domain-containing protein [Anaerolineaceae bacterium]